MNKGKDYKFDDILQFALDNDYTVTEINAGSETIGQAFAVLEHNEKDIIISFVLSGATGHEYIYECVYSDVPTLP